MCHRWRAVRILQASRCQQQLLRQATACMAQAAASAIPALPAEAMQQQGNAAHPRWCRVTTLQRTAAPHAQAALVLLTLPLRPGQTGSSRTAAPHGGGPAAARRGCPAGAAAGPPPQACLPACARAPVSRGEREALRRVRHRGERRGPEEVGRCNQAEQPRSNTPWHLPSPTAHPAMHSRPKQMLASRACVRHSRGLCQLTALFRPLLLRTPF